MDKILITGGAGFIGTKIVQKLIRTHKIIILDNFSYQIHRGTPFIFKEVTYITGCITDKKSWKLALDLNPDYIIHLASETGTGQSMDELYNYNNTNILGTSLMLESLKNIPNKVKKVVLSSSRAVYGEDINIETNTDLNPVSIYALTKLTQEKLFKLSCPIPFTILRYQNVYGPGQSLHNPYTGIISIFSQRFKNNKDIQIWDNAQPTRDFIYVDDVVDVTLISLNDPRTDYEIFNVGTGVKTKIIDIAYQLRDSINKNCNIQITDYHRKGDIMHAVANMDKTYSYFNWTPKYSVKKGIKNFIKYFKNKKDNE